MKTKEREIEIGDYDIIAEYNGDFWDSECRSIRYKHTFFFDKLINLKDAKLIIKEEIPETIKEFIKENNTTKKQVLEFLNKNYK